MKLSKRVGAIACALALTVFGCSALTGCGDDVAATWAHGSIKESEVTDTIENMRTYYGLDDDEDWIEFVAERSYDTSSSDTSDDEDADATEEDADATDEDADATQEDASSTESTTQEDTSSTEATDDSTGATEGSDAQGDVTSSTDLADSSTDTTDDSTDSTDEDADTSEDETSEVGTVEDLRAWVIEQLIRQDIIEYEIEENDITVSDEELDEYVEEQRAYIEAIYMEGVFESVLQMQGYEDIDDFRESARETLAEEKLQEQAVGSTDDTDAWEEYLDGLYAEADVQINDAPSDLSYYVDTSGYEPTSASDTDADATATTTEDTQTATDDTTTEDAVATDDTTTEDAVATDETTTEGATTSEESTEE